MASREREKVALKKGKKKNKRFLVQPEGKLLGKEKGTFDMGRN